MSNIFHVFFAKNETDRIYRLLLIARVGFDCAKSIEIFHLRLYNLKAQGDLN